MFQIDDTKIAPPVGVPPKQPTLHTHTRRGQYHSPPTTATHNHEQRQWQDNLTSPQNTQPHHPSPLPSPPHPHVHTSVTTSTRPSRPSRVKSEAIQPRHRVSTYNPAIVSQLDNNRQSFPVFLPHTSQADVFPVFIYTCTYYVNVDGTRQAHKTSLLGHGGFENVDRHSIGTRAHHVWWACLRRGYVSSMMRAS